MESYPNQPAQPEPSASSASDPDQRDPSFPLSTASTAVEGYPSARFIITFHLISDPSTVPGHGPVTVDPILGCVLRQSDKPTRTFRLIAKQISEQMSWQADGPMLLIDSREDQSWGTLFKYRSTMEGSSMKETYVMGELRMRILDEKTREEALEKVWIEPSVD